MMQDLFGRLSIPSLLAGGAYLALASAACAQGPGNHPPDSATAVPADQSPARSSTPDTDVAEVVVTAQKRSEKLQDVPLAVNVVTAQQLQANSVRDFADLNRAAPSLVVRPAENPVNASVSIRGIGTFAFSSGVEPSVAVVVDDVPVEFQARAFADLSDIERIEVLRGPQSTLYGKSASAGLINIVTPGPTNTFTSKATGLVTSDQEYQGNAVLSGPVAETLGYRVTVNFDKFNGNVHNLTTGDKVNGRRTFSTRNKLVWDPSSALNLTLGVDYINGSTSIGRPFIRLDPNALLRNNPAYPQSVFAPGITVGPNNNDVDNNYTSGTSYHDAAQSLRASLDLGGPTLMSITSHDEFKEDDTLDQDESPIVALDNRQFGNFGSRQWSQEFRLLSPGRDRFRYTLGLFYADVTFSRDFTRGPYYSQARWNSTNESAQYAGFGQLEYDILPRTTLIAGGRYAYEKVSYTFLDILNKGAYFSGDNGDSYGTYKLALQQRFGENLMLFASYATGHKGEAYDLSTGFNSNRALAGPVKPETSNDWELGARSEFFDRRLTLNITLFDTHFKDFQAQGIEILPDGTTNYRLANVGKLRTRGVEVEATGRLDRDLTLAGSVTYDDARITSFPFAQCYPAQTVAQGCIRTAGGVPAHQDLSGARPAQAPEWKATANFDYSHSLGSLPFEAVAQGAYTYQTRINYALSQDPQTVQGGYGIANLAVGIRQPDHHYEVMAFVNNLFNKHYYENLTDSRSNYNNLLATQSYLPRDFYRYAGIRAVYSF